MQDAHAAQNAEGARLFAALSEGEPADVKALIAASAPAVLNYIEPASQQTVLQRALSIDRPQWHEYATQLIEAGAGVRGSLQYVACRKSSESARLTGLLLARGADPNRRSRRGIPLKIAIKNANVPVVRQLLAGGADPNIDATDGSWEILLYIYYRADRIGQEDSVAMARALIAAGIDLTSRNHTRKPPLNYLFSSPLIAEHARADEFEAHFNLLVEAGADLNDWGHPSSADNVPLWYAAVQGHTLGVRLLLDAGADVNYTTFTGQTALCCAAVSNDLVSVQMLIDAGADPNRGRSKASGYTTLHQAVMADNVAVAKMLIECGADVTLRANNGETPAQLASSPEMVALFAMCSHAKRAD